MTLVLNCFILGCFGSIGAALALLLGLHHPVHLSIATGLGIALPLVALLFYVAGTNRDTEPH
jgi:hypothetical protein